LREADKDKAAPDLLFQRHQAVAREVEIFKTLPGWNGLQRAVEAIAPSVIGTDQAMAAIARFAGRNARGAMAASIVEATHHAIAAAQREKFLAQNIERVVVAGLGDIVDMADEMPGAGEDVCSFRRE